MKKMNTENMDPCPFEYNPEDIGCISCMSTKNKCPGWILKPLSERVKKRKIK